ncbi:hypothetical protein [Liquorilactobacillus hordei]|uniref:hypothetical protein n=1 Tax=Liquorilactobacillus hordei TaxID=468911 RepID=UPI0039ED6C4A
MTAEVNITGVEETLAKLEQKFSKRKLTMIENQALTVAGRYMAVTVKKAVQSYADTGATVREVTDTKPRVMGGERILKVGWEGDGSKQRWQLVHLNEFGYTRFGRTYAPRGLGKIQGAYNAGSVGAMALQAKQLRKLVD